MSNLSGKERGEYVQGLFARIAHRYDLMNRLMTAGQDRHWREQVIRQSKLGPNSLLLDIGTGTGDLAREALRQQPSAHVIAADFTLEMMRVGQFNPRRPSSAGDARHAWSAADVSKLPFNESTFDAIVSGFLMRNVGDIQGALKEQYRVLEPRGMIVILDTTRPSQSLLSPIIWFYTHMLIPIVGGLLSGSKEAYEYLPASTDSFITVKEMAVRMAAVGFKRINYETKMFGTVAIHWGEKPHE